MPQSFFYAFELFAEAVLFSPILYLIQGQGYLSFTAFIPMKSYGKSVCLVLYLYEQTEKGGFVSVRLFVAENHTIILMCGVPRLCRIGNRDMLSLDSSIISFYGTHFALFRRRW